MSRPVSELHADWLRLVEPEGQFLSLPVLNRAFSSGLDVVPLSVRSLLSEHFPSAQRGATPGDDQWDAWLEWLLRDVLAWGSAYLNGDSASIFRHVVPERDVVLRADGALVDPETEKPRVLVARYPHGTPLDRRLAGERWNTSPLDRLALLCRAHAVRIALLTDGERVLLAWIPAQGAGGHASWETGLFTESRERNLLQSFISLLHASRFFAVREGDQLESLFEESARAESDVTDRLGFQVRQAVELITAAISRADLESNGALLAGIAPQHVYEAAATVMMRLIFLLFAEERDLLPLDDPFYADSYAASTLREQLDMEAIIEGDEPLERRSTAWFRLLALFRVIYAGLDHDRLRIPPYGGRLFDPDRFPFLEGRTADESWSKAASRPLPVDDLTVRAVLEALQTLPIREGGSRERRRLSFRALDVEQIGHVYEGLLDHGAVRVDDVYVGLVGKSGDEAEIPLRDLEQKAREGQQPLVSFLHDFTGKSEGAIVQLIERGRAIALGRDPDARRLLNTSCNNDAALAGRVSPFFHTLRRDLHDLPAVFPPQSLVVKQTRQRRSTGTEYTPRDLAEEMVRYTLEPLVYSPGPRDGLEPALWRLRSSRELLDLRICDPTVGSGAFLVSACRYLGDLVVEAWISEDPERKKSDREDLTLEARRAVVDRCLSGVDRDAMAVEMAKLSLWLVTMARERPFSFLDHAIRCGDSLLGITSLDQLRYLHVDPEDGKRVHASLFNVMSSVQPLVDKAIRLREELESIPTIGIRDADEKRRLNEDADRLLERAKVLADGVIATALATVAASDNQREAAYFKFGTLVTQAFDNSIPEVEREGALKRLRLRNEQVLNSGRSADGPLRLTLHWPLVFPEVFAHGGFDAIVGNPPFLGNRLWKPAFGESLQSIVQLVLGASPGKIDLCVAFHRRAVPLLRDGGTYALLAANAIAHGSAISVGLAQIVKVGEIFLSRNNVPWPGSAAVVVAIVCFYKGNWTGSKDADGHRCSRIGPRLEPEDDQYLGEPKKLRASIFSFEGINNSKGLALVLTASSPWFDILKSEPESLLRPYVTGDDILSHALTTTERWALDIENRKLEEIEHRWPKAYQFLIQEVKPTRGQEVLASYPGLYDRWWQFWNHRAQLMTRLRHGATCIAYPKTTKYPICMLAPSGWLYTNQVVLIGGDIAGLLPICLSSLFRSWLELYSGRHVGTAILKLSITKAIATFPLPSAVVSDPGIFAAQRFNDISVGWAREQNFGLTEVMNDVNSTERDSEQVVQLRHLIEKLDRYVLTAFGWEHHNLNHDFYHTRDGIRWTMCEEARNEILERLLELNHKRHSEEVKADAISNVKAAVNGPRRSGRRQAAEDGPASLRMAFNDDGQTRLEL